MSSDSGNDTNIVILTDVPEDTRETVSALGCDVYVKIEDPCCKGYKVYVDGVYQFTEGQDGTPDGYCAFDVSAGTHTIKITKNGRSASKANYFQCGTTYRWVSMPHCWCEDGDDDECKYPPTVKFDKTKYYEGDTVHATVSTSHNSVYYKIKDCGGTVRKSGTTSNGKKISYTIPKGASKCCYWQICFYWDEYIPPMALARAGGEVTALSYDCTECYKFYVCPKTTCEVYVIIDDDTCVGYKLYVDGVYQFTEGQDGTPDGYCAFYVKEGTHTLKITKNSRSASKTINFECNIVYRWVSMPDNWCNPCANPPNVTFDKPKYNESETMHATVSTSSGSVNYEIKDCSGTVRKSGDISNGGAIHYTIPKGTSKNCCNWQICFYWGETSPPIAAAGAGGEVTAQSYDCTKCYDFYVCPGEKPAPEIIKVTYPTTCVKEGEDATISVTVENKGGMSSEGYISVSFPNDEEVSVVSGTGNGYNKLYPKGFWSLWNSKGEQMTSVDPLVELFETNWDAGEKHTLTMNVKPNSGSDAIEFLVRAALKNDAEGNYERDPTSGDTDQQGWYVKKYSMDVCEGENIPVKFIGEITGEGTPISSYEFDVRVDEIVSDPDGKLEAGETVSVWAHKSAFTIEAGVGDRVEVFGLYKGTFIGMDKIQLEDSAHFMEEQAYRWIKTDENAKFDCGTNDDYFTVSFYIDWDASQIKIAAETGENLRSISPVLFWDAAQYEPSSVSKHMRLLDASKGMIELWPNKYKYDEVKGPAIRVKIYYRITTYSSEKDKLDRIAWTSTHGDLVLLTGENKDFVMKVWGDNTDDYYTETRIYGGTDRFKDRLLMNWEGNVTKEYFTVGDEINLDVPSGTITMKILELKWSRWYDRILLEKVKVDYEVVLQDPDPPNLIVTGDLPYYDEPLQVFFKGTKVYDLQHPQVCVQNPYEYTYIVEYWNDTNNNYDIDRGDKWEKETKPRFYDITTSDSEFDLIVQDLPVSLYRVRIEGTDYWSNNFYVILNPFDSGLSAEYLYKYWMDEESGWRDCSGIGLTGIPYIICKIMYTLKPHRTPTNIRNHDGEMLMIMASNWREHHVNIINEEEYIIEEFNTFLLNSMTRTDDLTPIPSPIPPEDINEYVNDIKSTSSDPPIGDCDCFAVFLVALGRTSGIPSRYIYGNGDDRVEGPGKWGHGWAEMYYNGEWHVWDPYNRLSVCGGPYGSNYSGYANCLLRESPTLIRLNFIVDEHNFDRSSDYGVTLPEAIISSLECPANLHAYDSQGRHVGVKELGDIDLEIPSAYYTGPDSESESIMILNQNEDITFKVEALDSGEFDFTLAQSTETQTTTVTYLDVPISETTEATVDVSQENPTYTMEWKSTNMAMAQQLKQKSQMR